VITVLPQPHVGVAQAASCGDAYLTPLVHHRGVVIAAEGWGRRVTSCGTQSVLSASGQCHRNLARSRQRGCGGRPCGARCSPPVRCESQRDYIPIARDVDQFVPVAVSRDCRGASFIL